MSIELLSIVCYFVWLFGVGCLYALRIHKRAALTRSVPSCGHCGYCIVGLERPLCPECGSDLRVVGILSPDNYSTKRAYGFLLLGMGWTTVVVFIGYTAWMYTYDHVKFIEQWMAVSILSFCVTLWVIGAYVLRKRYERGIIVEPGRSTPSHVPDATRVQ
jgi:hypothetical protein